MPDLCTGRHRYSSRFATRPPVAALPYPLSNRALLTQCQQQEPTLTARDYQRELTRRALNEAEAADFLGISRSSLRKGRMNGTRANHLVPPPFVRLGRRIVYLIDDLSAYLERHRALTR